MKFLVTFLTLCGEFEFYEYAVVEAPDHNKAEAAIKKFLNSYYGSETIIKYDCVSDQINARTTSILRLEEYKKVLPSIMYKSNSPYSSSKKVSFPTQ